MVLTLTKYALFAVLFGISAAAGLVLVYASLDTAIAAERSSSRSVDTQVESSTSRAAERLITTTSSATHSSTVAFSTWIPVEPSSNTSVQPREIYSQSNTQHTQSEAASHADIRISSTSLLGGIFESSTAHTSVITVLGAGSEPMKVPVVSTVPASPSVRTVLGANSVPETVPVVSTVPALPSVRTITSYEPVKFKQNAIPNNVFEIVYDHMLEHNELIVTSNETALTKIVVREETNDPKINLKNLIEAQSDQNVTATFPNNLEMNVVFDGISADLHLKNDTEITGPPDWDGVVNLPVFTVVNVPTVQDPDTAQEITSVLHVGLDEDMLVFDKPVSITFGERAAQDVFFREGGGQEQVLIHTTCDANDEASVSAQLNGIGECRIDVGVDLIVWTYHFTDFITVGHLPLDLVPPEPSVDPDDPPIPGTPPDPPDIPPTMPDPPETLPPVPELPRDRQTSRLSSSGGGGGGGGGGGSHPASGSLDDISVDLYSVSWDCNAGTVRIIAGPDEPDLVSAQIRTTAYGMQQAAILSDEMLEGCIVFTSGIAPDESYVGVQVHAMSGRSILSVSEGITVQECVGEETFSTYREPADPIPQHDGILHVPSGSGVRDEDPAMPPAFVPEPVEPEPVEPAVPAEPAEPTMPAEPAEPKPAKSAEDRGPFEMFVDFIWRLFGW